MLKLEHRAHAYWCQRCQKIHYLPLPQRVVKAGFMDEHHSATVCFLKYVGSMSFSAIKQYFKNVHDIKVSKGQLAKIIPKGSRSLEESYNELLNRLPYESVVNTDENSHKENGGKSWNWVFRSNLYALFKISPSRGSEVLIDVLGRELNGILGCDYFSAHRKYMKDFDISIQFCLAHLIRNIKFLAESHDPWSPHRD
ncbi:MAG: transposase [Chitinivibrionales bacterium]|nr:transposase [Chitinivibrionales bacterium]